MKKVLFYTLFFAGLVSNTWSMQLAADSISDSREIRINEIFIIGNKKTRAEIIRREMTIKKDKSYTRDELDKLKQIDMERVYNTNLFNEVTIEILETSTEIMDVLVKVDERWYFYPAPILEIADRNLMDWLINRGGKLNRINYGLKVDQYNFRGRNEQIRFIGQLGFERKFILRYSVPYIEKSQRHGLIFDVAYNEREDMPYITQDHLPTYIDADEINRTSWLGAITHSYRPSFYDFHYTTIGYMTSQVSDTIVQLNDNYFGDGRSEQRFFRLAYTYINDHRNVRTYATRGHFFQVTAEKLGLGIYDDLNIFTLSGIFTKYSDLGNQFYLANSVIGLASFPNDQPYFNFNGLGYYEIYQRGFELDVVEGPIYLLLKNSFRKRLINYHTDISEYMPIKQFSKFKFVMYGKFFTDFAWVDNYQSNAELSHRLANTLLYSAGFGLDLVTMYDLTLRLEYSYNSEREFNFALNIKADM